MRRFFIDRPHIGIDTIYRIADPEANHIQNVLRLKPGDNIRLFNGTGAEFKARILSINPGTVEVTISEVFTSKADPPYRLTVGLGFLKQKKMDILVRQLTELGIYRWLPLFTERAVVKPDQKRMEARTNRWQTIAREAIKQCERGLLPEILPPVSFAEALAAARESDLNLIFTARQGEPIRKLAGPGKSPKNITALLGPEGGFTPGELEQAEAYGFIAVSLGPGVLKADTAAVAACAAVQNFFGN